MCQGFPHYPMRGKRGACAKRSRERKLPEGIDIFKSYAIMDDNFHAILRKAGAKMRLTIFQSVRAFYERVRPILLAREALNNLPVGILERGLGEEQTDWFMATLTDDAERDVLVALRTPPQNLILVSPDGPAHAGAVEELARSLSNDAPLPGVIGEKELALLFARHYAEAAGVAMQVQMEERVYRLDAVADVPRAGTLRPATEQDLYFLPYWQSAFEGDCFGTPGPLDAEAQRAMVVRGDLFLLEAEGQPVSLVGTTRQMPHGRSVGPVYTPPYFRGRGYASSAVAQLSEEILRRGNDYCALFADLANPISNGIYQKIGYRPLCDYAMIAFKA